MANNSREYKRLLQRISTIEAGYFPPLKPKGNYTLKEQDDIRAYAFLIHAELEYYFEEIAREKSRETLNKWIANNNYRNSILMSLASFHNIPIAKKRQLRERLEITLKTYHDSLYGNNGIKEQNILGILLPLGVLYDDIDNTWLTTISSFGLQRGSIAHQSARVQTLQDPNDIRNNIRLILQELNVLDQKIKRLK